jgi:tripartite-type tricarboxylate transporter receptor subunit TctC
MMSGKFWLAAVLAFCVSAPTQAQPYPSKPIRIIASFSAGSQVDVLTRILAEKLSAALGQQVIVDNRVGAGGTIAAAAVSSAPADGYTLLATANGFAINPALYKKLPFDTAKGFSGVSLIGTVPSVLLVPASRPMKSVADFISAARAKPGTLTYASGGVGSASHLGVELLKTLAMIEVEHAPYKDASAAIADLVGGRVDFSLAPVGASLAMVRDGKARALAVTTAERSALLPDVPTFAEAGIASYRFDFWYGWLAPTGTPKPVMDRLAAEVQKALAMADVKAKYRAQGVIESSVSPPLAGAAFDKFIVDEITRYAALVKQSGASAE